MTGRAHRVHADPVSPDPHVLADDHLPTPFTAAEIREATPPGRTVTVHHESGGPTPSVTSTRILWAEVSADGAIQHRVTEPAEGADTPTRLEVTWHQLQEHASFPAATTVRERVVVDHVLGRLDCWRYTVTEGGDETTFWFDIDRPGMPVQVESRRGTELLATMTVVADTLGEDARPA